MPIVRAGAPTAPGPQAARPGNDVPPHFLCPITLDTFRDPVVAPDGRTYEREVIVDWFEHHGHTSPITGENLPSGRVVPNWLLRSEMQDCGLSPKPPCLTKDFDHTVPADFECAADRSRGVSPPGARPSQAPAALAVRLPSSSSPLRSGRGLPPLLPLPELSPLPPLGVAMHTPADDAVQNALVWAATGQNETAALAALDELCEAAEQGHEQALHYIATGALHGAVRRAAVMRLGDMPSVAAVDFLCDLARGADSDVARMAAFRLSGGTAQMLDRQAGDPPAEVDRCLRDLAEHLQGTPEKAQDVLFVLKHRAGAVDASGPSG